MADSPIIKQADDLEHKLGPDSFEMKPEQTKQYNLIARRLDHARTQRDMNRDEWDGMNYNLMYQTNQRAMNSYLAPKINNDDVRINTGTTEKKVEYVMNQILSLNLQGEILAYDKDDHFLDDVSVTLTDIVRRTEQMEEADDKDLFIYAELLSQPCVFVEELWIEKRIKDSKGKWKTVKQCERRMLQGPQVYLGDINIPDYRFQDQPFIFKYFRMTYNEAETLYGDLDRWQFVKPGSYNNLTPVPYQIYRKNSLLDTEVEGFVYMCPNDNEYQLILQGIPMFDPGEPLPWEWQGYNIVCVGLKPMHGDFAYGKSLVQAAKTLQALDNEMIRNFVRKTRQSIEPPTGVPTGKVFSRDIWSAGSMVQGVTKETFSPLLEAKGVNAAEFQMFDLIQTKISEFIGTDAMGAIGGGRMTAQQTLALQKIALQMIGLAVIAANRLESKLAMMRCKNILANYMKPTGKKVDPITKKLQDTYAQFSLNDTGLSNGTTGQKVIKIMDRQMSEAEQFAVDSKERQMKASGKPTEYVAMDATLLKNVDLYFHAVAVSKPKDARDLEKSMFQDELAQAQIVTQLTGRPLSPDKTTEKFERIWGDKDIFEKQAMGQGQGAPAGLPQGSPTGQPQPNGQPAVGGNPASPTAPQPLPRPSVNTVLNGR